MIDKKNIPSENEKDGLDEYTSVSWQVIIYVLVGIVVAVIFDRVGYFGYLSEGVVRAIAGTADTFGLTLAAVLAIAVTRLQERSLWAKQHLPDLKPRALTWIKGGLFGLVLAFILQALVYLFAADPYGPIGVVYAFAFSNLDNTMAGLFVLFAALMNHGGSEGWRRYWRHPYFVGNAFMLVLIPTIAILIRVLGNFRPELNISAGIESGLMDVDSVGAALIFVIATRIFKAQVPYINDNLPDASAKFRLRFSAKGKT